jgi:hypothetical protein
MLKHIWTIVCKQSKIEADTNNISIIDSYENLRFDLRTNEKEYDKTKPAVGNFEFEVVSLFYRDKKGAAETHDVVLKVVDPKNKILGEFDARMEFKEQHNRMRNRMKFDKIALTTSGTYIFQVFLKLDKDEQELVAAVPVDIVVILDGKEL